MAVNLLSGVISNVEIDRIRLPKNALRSYLGDLNELMDSISSCGLLQPIVIRPVGDEFEIVAGHRRFEVCRELGWRQIPCHIVALDDKEAFEAALVENIQRKTLSPVEEARAFKVYVEDFGWGGVTDLARRIGKSIQYVSQRLQILRLPADVLRRLDEGAVTPSLLREIVGLDEDVQRRIVEMAVDDGLSSRRVGRIARGFKVLSSGVDSFLGVCSSISEADRRFNLVDRSLYRCINASRGSLIEFDDVIDDIGDDWLVRDMLMMQRRAIHDQIDALIRFRARFKRYHFYTTIPT